MTFNYQPAINRHCGNYFRLPNSSSVTQLGQALNKLTMVGLSMNTKKLIPPAYYPIDNIFDMLTPRLEMDLISETRKKSRNCGKNV